MINTMKCDFRLFLYKMCFLMVWKFCEIWKSYGNQLSEGPNSPNFISQCEVLLVCIIFIFLLLFPHVSVNNSPKWNGFRLELSTSLRFMHIDRVNSMILKGYNYEKPVSLYWPEYFYIDILLLVAEFWPRGYKLFFILNPAEHEIYPAHKS